MRIAIVDADLISRKRHRFPNLACMKISGYHKERGDEVVLVTSFGELFAVENRCVLYDKVYISKVFTDTVIPECYLNLKNAEYGGTGFFYDKAPKLPDEVEHQKPDYHLYDDWVSAQIANGKKPSEFSYYTDYSIGFLTRGCFRHCDFCVNKNYSRVRMHSPLFEFYDESRPKICLLDDNFFGCPNWRMLLEMLQATGRPFQFKQGLDERLLTEEKCEVLFRSKYDGDYIFAFDNIEDRPLIEEKLNLIKKHTNKVPKFYVLCGYDRTGKWDDDFWKKDIECAFLRTRILFKHGAIPYLMRFNRINGSDYKSVYSTMARWTNQPRFVKKMSFREFCIANGVGSSAEKALIRCIFELGIDKCYLNMKWGGYNGND